MPRNADRNRSKKRAPSSTALRRRVKPKVCIVCRDHLVWVDYKDVGLLRRFLSDRAKIKARRVTGTCHRHQRDVATAVKTARELALLPYTQRTVADKVSDRGGRRGRSTGPGGSSGSRSFADATTEAKPPDAAGEDMAATDGADAGEPTAVE